MNSSIRQHFAAGCCTIVHYGHLIGDCGRTIGAAQFNVSASDTPMLSSHFVCLIVFLLSMLCSYVPCLVPISPCTSSRPAIPGSARAFIHPLSLCSIHYYTISYMFVIVVKGKTGICQHLESASSLIQAAFSAFLLYCFLVHLCCTVHHHFHLMTIQSLYIYFLHNLSHPFHHIKVLMTGRLSNHM